MKRFLAALALLGGTAGLLAQEKVSFPSLDGEVRIPAYWFAANGGGRRAAIVDLHGCGGVHDARGKPAPAYLRDALYFNREAIHVLVPDSFTPRGQPAICEIPMRERAIDEWMRATDVHAALRWLEKRPDVDRRRIALLGRSHGGSTVLTALNLQDPAMRSQPTRPRAAVALYPGCGRLLRAPYEPGSPLLLLAGELDDWTPAAQCAALRERTLRVRPGTPFEMVVYPGSHHGFDGSSPVRVRANLQTKSGQATVGGNPEAAAAAYRRLFEFLSRELDAPLRLSHEERFRPR